MQSAIALVLGNGFTLSLQQHLTPYLDKWHPSRPLSWHLTTPGKPNVPLAKALPRFAAAIAETKKRYPGITDFQIFDKILQVVGDDPSSYHHLILKAEMRHFLAIAYSHFQLKISLQQVDNWPWLTWFQRNRQHITSAVSFNYDLVLEKVFEKLKVPYYRVGIGPEYGGIPIFKPHGSIDFEVRDICNPVTYPIDKVVRYIDSLRRCLRDDELLQPRTEVDIVLPKEYSPFLRFRWVYPGYERFKQTAARLTHCYFIGLSYSHADRPEIDFLLDCLRPPTEVIMINPHPPRDFIQAIQLRGLQLEVGEQINIST